MGKTHFSGAVVDTDIEVLVADGTISVIKALTILDGTSAGVAATLADGEDGQIKKLVAIDATNAVVVTPANLAAGTTLTFTVNDTITLQFFGSAWYILSNNGVVVA